MSTLGELLRARRDVLGLTLQEVGDAAGMSKGHLHEIEGGKHKNPGLFTCTRLAIALGLSVQQMAAAIIETHIQEPQ